jgi:hypothetical protein
MLSLFPPRQRPQIELVPTDKAFWQKLSKFRTPDSVFEAQGDEHGDIDMRLVESIESYLEPFLGQWEGSDTWWHQMDYYGDGIRSLMFQASAFQPRFVPALHALLKGEHAELGIVCQLHESLTQDGDSKIGSIAICADKLMVNRALAQFLAEHA